MHTDANDQYGIPTPKALPAFSADEAEKVARDFGKSLSQSSVVPSSSSLAKWTGLL